MFPLRLTAFEELFFREDSLQHPQTFACTWWFDRQLNLELARRALSMALQRHPLLATQVQLNAAGEAEFYPSNDLPGIVEATGGDIDEVNIQIDPCNEPLVRLIYRRYVDPPELVWIFHHCAVDGLGSSQIMQSWFANYQFLEAEHDGELKQHRLDENALAMRCRPNLTFREQLKLLPGQWLSVLGTIRFFKRKVIPLVSLNRMLESDAETTKARLSVCHHVFDTDVTGRIRGYAEAQNVTVNSVMIRELFLAIEDWQKSLGDEVNGTHWRISVPVNERTIKHRRMSACNHCTIVSIDRSREELRDQDSLLSGIQSQMDTISRWRLSLNMWRILALMNRFQRHPRRNSPSTKRCRSTCVLTNVGDASHRLSGARFAKNQSDATRATGHLPSAPIRWGTPVAITAYYFQNSLNISLRYDANLISDDQAGRLLNTYCGLLQRRAEHS